MQALFQAIVDASVGSVQVNAQPESIPNSGPARGEMNLLPKDCQILLHSHLVTDSLTFAHVSRSHCPTTYSYRFSVGRRNARNKHRTAKNTDVNKDDILPYIDNFGLDCYSGDTSEFLNKPVSLFLPVITQVYILKFIKFKLLLFAHFAAVFTSNEMM